MEDKTTEATDSLSKDTGGIVGLDRLSVRLIKFDQDIGQGI